MDVEILIDQLRLRMERMTDSERLDMVDKLMHGYCPDCGARTLGRLCYCTHDE